MSAEQQRQGTALFATPFAFCFQGAESQSKEHVEPGCRCSIRPTELFAHFAAFQYDNRNLHLDALAYALGDYAVVLEPLETT